MLRFQTIYLWWANLGMLPIKSTAATYTERAIKKKSCLNNLTYNSWKHFKIQSEILFSVWNFISNNFPRNENLKKSPFPLFFSPSPLILKNCSSPRILLSSKIQRGEGAAAMLIWYDILFSKPKFENQHFQNVISFLNFVILFFNFCIVFFVNRKFYVLILNCFGKFPSTFLILAWFLVTGFKYLTKHHLKQSLSSFWILIFSLNCFVLLGNWKYKLPWQVGVSETRWCLNNDWKVELEPSYVQLSPLAESSLLVCSCYVTYAFQSESTLYVCLNVKELLARNRRIIWSLSGCNWTQTRNHLVRKQTLNHLAILSKWFSVRLRTKWLWVQVPLGSLKVLCVVCQVVL